MGSKIAVTEALVLNIGATSLEVPVTSPSQRTNLNPGNASAVSFKGILLK